MERKRYSLDVSRTNFHESNDAPQNIEVFRVATTVEVPMQDFHDDEFTTDLINFALECPEIIESFGIYNLTTDGKRVPCFRCTVNGGQRIMLDLRGEDGKSLLLKCIHLLI